MEDLTIDIDCARDLFRFLDLKGYDPLRLKRILSNKLNQQVSGTYPNPAAWPQANLENLWRICGSVAKQFGYSENYCPIPRVGP
jgi:hypothetical protein